MGRAAVLDDRGDRARGTPDEVGGMRADDEGSPRHRPASSYLTTAIVRTSSSEKPASSRRSAIRASPSSTGGFATWPRSVERTLCSGPVARIASNVASHETFPVWIGAKQRSSIGSALGELALLVDRDSLCRIVRVGHDHAGDAGGESRVDDAVDLGPAEVPRREHEVVACDDVEHLREAARRQLHRPVRDADLRELVLDRSPDRLLRGLRAVLARLVLGVDRRQPDDPCAFAGRDLDRLCVESTDAGVERDRAERAHVRHGAAHDGRALRCRHIVRLEHEAFQPELGEASREPEVVDATAREIGLDVDMEVVGAADELTRASGRLSVLRRQGVLPPRAPEVCP